MALKLPKMDQKLAPAKKIAEIYLQYIQLFPSLGWSNCTSIIPLRTLQLLPWARLDWPCKDTSSDMKMMMRSTLARAWGQIPECLRCDYTPRSGPTYTPMTNIQLQLQKKSFKDLFLKQNT